MALLGTTALKLYDLKRLSIKILVSSICAFDDAPNNTDSILGNLDKYSMASLGRNAPAARTCIAIGLKVLSVRYCSYNSIPPDILNPILLIELQIIGFSIPTDSRASNNLGIFIVIYPGSALYFFLT